jgi:hypothetical protein
MPAARCDHTGSGKVLDTWIERVGGFDQSRSSRDLQPARIASHHSDGISEAVEDERKAAAGEEIWLVKKAKMEMGGGGVTSIAVTGNQPWLKQNIDRSTYFRRKAKAATRFVRNSENDVRLGSSAAQEAARLGSSATINTYSAEQPRRTHHKRHRHQRASKGVSDPKATDNPLYQNMTKEDERGWTPGPAGGLRICSARVDDNRKGS